MSLADPLPKAPTPKAVLEAAVYASDLEAAARFYGHLLGFEEILRVDGRHVFFRVGTTILLVFNPDQTERPTENTRLPVPPHGARGPGHVCFAMSRAEIGALRNRLVAAEVPIDAEFDWPNGAHSLYVRDPAGNSVEFAEPRLWSL